jgi:uncharacterized protein (DUF983 family)
MKKGTKLYSILRMRCPRCQEGAVFKNKNPYVLSDMFKLHEACPNCGLHYELEPGFFYGAMYVSYGYGVALFVATYLTMEILYEPGIWDIIAALAIIMILGSPLLLRLSRITYLNIFVKYNPHKRGAHIK